MQATAKTAQIFLGLQVQCTQCHNHPFNDWKQNQFWELNAFFRQMRAVVQRPHGSGNRETINVQLVNQNFSGEDNRPDEAEIFFELRNGKMEVAYPVFVDGTQLKQERLLERSRSPQRAGQADRRLEYMGKAIVNRMWAHFLGYGFTKPVDDLGPHNPPTHPELLDRLGNRVPAGTVAT